MISRVMTKIKIKIMSLFGIVGLVEALPDMVSIPISMIEFSMSN